MNRLRNSSIEVLRIIAMFMIIFHHYVVHGYGESITINNLTGNVLFLQFIASFGKSACSLFALITGYYLINSKNIIQKIIPLCLEILFYGCLAITIALIIGTISIDELKSLQYVFSIFTSNWYMVVYLTLLIFVPFINMALQRMNKNEHFWLLVAFLMLYVLKNITLSYNMAALAWMVSMYCVGAYIGAYHKNIEYNKIYLIISLVFAILMLLSVYVLDLYYLHKNGSMNFSINELFTNYSSILSLGFSIALFIYVVSLPKFNNKLINSISSTTGGVYLFHDNVLTRTIIWRIISPNILYFSNPYIHILIKTLIVFAIGVLIDLLRQKIYRLLLAKPVSTLNQYIETKFKTFNNKITDRI